MLSSTIRLILAKSTRILAYILLGFLFNIGEQTDKFFLAYSLAAFATTVAVSTESYFLKQNKKMLGVLIVGLGPLILVLALAIFVVSDSLLVFLFLPYIVLSTLASLYTGAVNEAKRYTITLVSYSSYILMLPLVLIARMLESSYTLELVVALITLPELIRLILLIKLSKSTTSLWAELKQVDRTLFLILSVPTAATIVLVIERLIIESILPSGSVSLWAYSFGFIGVVSGLVNYARVVRLTSGDKKVTTAPLSLAFITSPLKLGLVMMVVTIAPVVVLTILPLNIETAYLSLNLSASIREIFFVLVIASFLLPLKYTMASLVVELISKDCYRQLLISTVSGTIARLVLISILSQISLEAAAVGAICSELIQLVIVYFFVRRNYLFRQYYSFSS